MPVGTHMKRVDLADHDRPLEDFVHGDHPTDEFRRGDCLRLMFPEQPYSIWLHWSRTSPGQFTGWYVNLEAPFVRTDIGVDTTDHSLDLVITPDFDWRWKDAELTADWIQVGVYTQAETDRFFADGERVIEMAVQKEFPFDGSYLDWTPCPEWTLPTIHPEWSRVPGYDLNLTTRNRLKVLPS